LKDEHLEHEDDVIRFSPGIGKAFFVPDFGKLVTKNFPIDELVEFRQKGSELMDFFHTFFEIEKTELAFVFAHGFAWGTGGKEKCVVNE
jgi:hypothetical protein